MLGVGAHLGAALAARHRLQLGGEAKVRGLADIVIPAFAALIGLNGQHLVLLKKIAHRRVGVEADMLFTSLHAEAIRCVAASLHRPFHQDRLRWHCGARSTQDLQGAVN